MYEENIEGPIIESRHHGNMPSRVRRNVLQFFLILGLSIYFVVSFIMEQERVAYNDYYSKVSDEYNKEMMLDTVYEETPQVEALKERLEDEMEPEHPTADYYYQKALSKEKAYDFDEAIEYYTKTTELAKTNSNEMFNALNNRGFLYAKEYKKYSEALSDFDKIIEIELAKVNYNNEHLEAAYSNRAFVRKMKGDKDGACDDLYNALAYCKPSSTSFIETQIEKNCW